MPFISTEDDGVEIGSVDGERAVRFRGIDPDHPDHAITFVEDDNGNRVISSLRIGDAELRFSATQIRALGMFCVRQFMAAQPNELLSRIELSAKGVMMSLEAWNERARIDEEHPPYESLVAELRLIGDALFELRKGLRP